MISDRYFNMLFEMRRFSASIFFCFVFATIICCSTTHHFISPQHIKKGDSEIIFSICYDFNRFQKIPDLQANFYWDIGKDYLAGFGYQMPFFISHATIAKSITKSQKDDISIYFSCSSLFTLNHSPLMEIGGCYSIMHDKSFHSFTLGVWTLPCAYWDIQKEKYERKLVLGPYFRYLLGHEDLRISMQNYKDITKAYLKDYRSRIKEFSPVLIPNSDIDTIFYYENWRAPGYMIKTKIKYAYLLTKFSPYYHGFAQDFFQKKINSYRVDSEHYIYFLIRLYDEGYGYDVNDFDIDFDKLLKQEDELYYVGEGTWYIIGGYEVNINSLIDNYKSGKDILIENVEENEIKSIEKIKWFKDDWSLGFGLKSRMKEE